MLPAADAAVVATGSAFNAPLVLAAMLLAALAAVRGGATDGPTIQENLAAVSGAEGGTECTGFAECRDLLEAGEDDVDQAKIGVKFVIGLVLLVLVMANTRKERIPTGLWAGLLVLAVANVGVAVRWSPVHA